MHAHEKSDGINAPQKIVSYVDLRPKKLPWQRQRVDRLFEQHVPVHNAGYIESHYLIYNSLFGTKHQTEHWCPDEFIKVIICFTDNKTAISIKYLEFILWGSKAK